MARIATLKLPAQKWLFVDDIDLRNILTRDYKELRAHLRTDSQKSAIVMCGSILGAALVSVLNTDRTCQKYEELLGRPLEIDSINNWGLEKLINVAVDLGYLDKNTQAQAHFIRNYRNLIHPGKERRDSFAVDSQLLTTVVSLFERSIGHLAKSARQIDDVEGVFLRQLKMVRGDVGRDTGQALIQGLVDLGFRKSWTKRLTFLPQFPMPNIDFEPISMRTDGRIRILFGYIKRQRTLFRHRAPRLELIRQLNEIPGVNIKNMDMDKFPLIELELLTDLTAREEFLGSLKWMIEQIQLPKKHAKKQKLDGGAGN